MKAAHCFEKSANIYKSTQCNMAAGLDLQ